MGPRVGPGDSWALGDTLARLWDPWEGPWGSMGPWAPQGTWEGPCGPMGLPRKPWEGPWDIPEGPRGPWLMGTSSSPGLQQTPSKLQSWCWAFFEESKLIYLTQITVLTKLIYTLAVPEFDCSEESG